MERLIGARGCYGQLFIRPCGTKVVKVFFNRENEGKTRKEIEAIFYSEVNAYKKASTHPELSHLVPKFYSTIIVSEGVGEPREFYPDLAYEIDFISGHFAPIVCPLIQSESSDYVINLFDSVGLDVSDSAATYSMNGIIQKVVDFGVKK